MSAVKGFSSPVERILGPNAVCIYGHANQLAATGRTTRPMPRNLPHSRHATPEKNPAQKLTRLEHSE